MPDNTTYASSAQPRVDQHRLRYRESVMAADAALGAFLEHLDRQGLLDSALVVVTSDHGESFEKGYLGHAGPLTHDSLIRVPLVVKLPGQKIGKTLNVPVSQADLAPTLLDMVGAPPLPHAEGRSLRAALEGKPLPLKPVFSMTMERQSRFEPIRYGRYVVIDGNDKLTLALDPKGNAQAEKVTLFDLAADPAETHDLAQQRPERSRELQTLLRSQLAEAEKRRIAGLQ
jgi:arylsulfatase A-like enzyme